MFSPHEHINDNQGGNIINFFKDFIQKKEYNFIENTIKKPNKKEIEHLSTHKQHDDFLIQCLNNAKKELIICSPFIGLATLDWIPFFYDVQKKGINIFVFSDYHSNHIDGFFKNTHTESAVLELVRHNLSPYFLENIHNKTIFYDDEVICEGSYNWLSAVRDKSSKYHNLEASLLYRGSEAKKMITEMKNNFKNKRIIKRINFN